MSFNPPSNEIEISIFGADYGECIVVHLGNNEWIIVDSFREQHSKKPVALEYLERINVDYSVAVKAIVATHWHDDHICGLSEVVNKCKRAMFVFSSAIQSKEFLSLIYSDADIEEKRPGNQELSTILSELRNRNSAISLATENKLILRGSNYEIYSLSPSDCSVLLAIKEIANLLPDEMQPRKGIPCIKPNHLGTVLLIIAGNQGILLGADMEESDDRSWTRIIDSRERPNTKSSIFKVPHHGSKTAYHSGVWTHLLEKRAFSFVTAFIRGKCSLPTSEDMKRILSHTDKAWIAGDPFKKKKAYKRDRTIEKTIKETVKSIRSLSDKGHIRARCVYGKEDVSWEISLFGEAKLLSDICK